MLICATSHFLCVFDAVTAESTTFDTAAQRYTAVGQHCGVCAIDSSVVVIGAQ
jgi:hypothetical protein